MAAYAAGVGSVCSSAIETTTVAISVVKTQTSNDAESGEKPGT
jgi:hypothetical protein